MTVKAAVYRTHVSLSIRLERMVWNIVWLIFAKYSPNAAFKYRNLILRMFGAKIGRDSRVYPNVRIWLPRHLEMGEHSCVGPGVNCYNIAKIKIGKNSVVSQYSTLCTASHDFNDPSFALTAAPITINEYSWIGANAIILPGISVGAGSIVGMGSVLTCTIGENEIFAGNPAKKIGTRELVLSSIKHNNLQLEP